MTSKKCKGKSCHFYQQTPSSTKAKEKLAGWLMSEYQLAEREFFFHMGPNERRQQTQLVPRIWAI
jgi:hypothetical protein